MVHLFNIGICRGGKLQKGIQNQKIFLENYAKGQQLTNIRHYIDDDESGRFFDRSAYSRMIEDVESGKIGVCIMKDLTRWGRDYLQVGNAMEIFRRNNVRFIAVNNGIDSENPDTLEFAPFINIMSEWYAKDISKKVKTGIKTKGMSGKPVATEAPYGYIKDPDNKDFWIIDKEAAEVVRLIFRLFLDGKNRNQIAVYLTQEQIPTPTFYMKDRGRGTCKNKTLNENNRYKWNKATLTHILTRQEYCGDVVNFKTAKHFRDKRNHYVDRSQWHITENVHEPIIDRTDFENVQRILENAPVKRPNGDGEIHPLSGLLFCKDCGAKMHIRIDYRNGGKRHVAYCSEYHKGKAKNPKCSSPHIMDADLLMQTVADVLKKIAEYSISNRAEFEALVKKSLAMQQTDKVKKQQKRILEVIPIAIYHCNISIVSRGKGKSAVAAAAYRSGEKLTNEWDGMTHDYTRKGGVVHNEIMLPPHAPPSFSDRSTLWNSVELYEKAGNAQLAREIDAALPIELSREEQIRLVREYCSSQFVSKGMCVDFAIHDTDSGNPHCHIMLTMRPLDERGAWAAKSKKEYDLDENGERIRLPSGRCRTEKAEKWLDEQTG